MVTFTLNGKSVTAPEDRSLLEIADEHGAEIPRLCYMPGMRADGNCRTCMVEIAGERVLAPSCCRYPKEGMEVTTNSARAVTSQKISLELLLADMPEASYTRESELEQWATKMGVGRPRFGARPQPAADLSHPAMAVHLDACIQCTRCVRACREEQVNDVIGYAFRGAHSKIVFDLDDPMGDSTCVACGECVQACPTGALMPARDAALPEPAQDGRFRVSVLRRGLPAHVPRQGQRHPLRAGPQRPGQRRPAVREGPLRLRLRPAPASADDAAHQEARGAEAQGVHGGSRPLAGRVPRRHVGRGAGLRREGPARRRATRTASARSRVSDRPRARTKRPTSSRSSCAPASARTTSITARGSATRRAWRR